MMTICEGVFDITIILMKVFSITTIFMIDLVYVH